MDEWLVLLHALEGATNSTKITLTYNARAAVAERWLVAWNLGEQTGPGPVETLHAALSSLGSYYGIDEWDP